MNRISLLLCAFTLALIGQNEANAAPDKLLYTCRGEKITGFDGRGGRGWESVSFDNANTYLIWSTNNGSEYQVRGPFKNNTIDILFVKKASSNDEYFIYFDFMMKTFIMSRKNLRFSSVSQNGFVNNLPNATPSMEIGYCQAN